MTRSASARVGGGLPWCAEALPISRISCIASINIMG
eukprot:CAMPEP_0195332086 /NCGR_PEP_ID=MMETSP0708-20121125/13076_1 /TAXON_ID=33640 /ORGANISM="Asterionellopsis glacialis, Strain CCMP134" /LENGTH=35 /DNA_ID= /DNA_START= /DNA_END= /DNA_ORIENTATION=